MLALGSALAGGNPAPHAAVVRLPANGVHVASASPERFLRRAGRLVESQPIKGTAAEAGGFLAKDRADRFEDVEAFTTALVDAMGGEVGEAPQAWIPADADLTRTAPRTELAEHLYGSDAERDSNTIEVFVARLRRKLPPGSIETVRGLGYRLEAAGG